MMATYRETLIGLVDTTDDAAGSVFDRTTGDTFATALTGLLLIAEARAVALTDLALADYLAVAPLGLTTTVADRAATTGAVATLLGRLDDTPDPRARTRRLARGRVTGTAGRYYDLAMTDHGVTGYVRGISASACELCGWLNRNDHVWPADRPMHRHPGCTCVPIPVT